MTYAPSVDPSGGVSNSMTLAIGASRPQRRVCILDALLEVRPPFDPEQAVAAVRRVCCAVTA